MCDKSVFLYKYNPTILWGFTIDDLFIIMIQLREENYGDFPHTRYNRHRGL